MHMIRIEVDGKSGFCTGVIRAVKTAEENLEKENKLFSLGELVHNPLEVGRLGEMGLKPVSYEDFDRLKNCTLLIRAHGEPPETFQKAAERNIRLVDATCPIVKKLQDRIREAYREIKAGGGSILIFGKADHPEVRALVGHSDGKAQVVREPEDLNLLEPPVYLYSQTTMNLDEYTRFRELLRDRMRDWGMDPDKDLHVHHTICRQVSSREEYIRDFAGRFDLILFVSGIMSSNGKALYRVCRQVNERSHFISRPEESDAISLEGVNSIGICGATSTPQWLLFSVKSRLEKRIKNVTGT